MLFGSTMLEVAIGMIFVYLLISLLCSAFSELIASILKLRAKDLERGIQRLLSNQQIAESFFNHPLIKPLYENRKPSYIPARTFSLALWNMATTAAAQARAGQSSSPPAPADGNIIAGVTKDLKLLRDTIRALPDKDLPGDLKQSLVTLMDEADNNFDAARENIEKWYDDAMDRVSGAFKRRTHWMLIGLGFLVAAAMNVDSINIANALSNNKDLRATVVSVAENYAKQPLPAGPSGLEESKKRIEGLRGEIDALGLPIGWSQKSWNDDPRGLPTSKGWPLKIFGFILTALAVSQGAPFWFDLLNKFIVIRSTVKPREKSQVQPSKDKESTE